MAGLLRLDDIIDRINGYVNMRKGRFISDPLLNLLPLKPETAYMLQEAFLRGHVARVEIIRVSGLAERTGRVLLGSFFLKDCWCLFLPKVLSGLAFRLR